jgi:L-lactate dehydrogenase complex protein LldG
VVEEAPVTSAREAILERVRSAPSGAGVAVAREYRRSGSLGHEERVARFCERVSEYRTTVRRAVDVPAAVAEACRGRSLVVPPELPAAWRPPGVELVEDRGLTPHELDAIGGALTGCTVAIAETGTIVLTAAPAEGRRALSLVPDLHVCVVFERQIVELLPEALERLLAEGLERRPLTFVSGPSATSDIELSRVEGVHGPRDLVVLVVEEAT